MGQLVDANGYIACNDGTPLVLELTWKRDASFTLTFYDPSTLAAKSVASATITATFRDRPYSSGILAQKTLTLVSSGTGGQATLDVADTDFASLNWDLGQRFRHVYFDLDILIGGNHYAVRDGLGLAIFAAVVWQSAYGVPN